MAEAEMTMTEQVLMETYRQTGGDLDAVVDTAAIAAALALERDEVGSTFRALELTGLVAFATEADTTRVRMTIPGVDRCRQRPDR